MGSKGHGIFFVYMRMCMCQSMHHHNRDEKRGILSNYAQKVKSVKFIYDAQRMLPISSPWPILACSRDVEGGFIVGKNK